jgi:hypothetical protein
MLKLCHHYYWRPKGTIAWRYGWPTDAGNGLIRMGFYNGDTSRGPVVLQSDIEFREKI